jgi:hypothetical protein
MATLSAYNTSGNIHYIRWEVDVTNPPQKKEKKKEPLEKCVG